MRLEAREGGAGYRLAAARHGGGDRVAQGVSILGQGEVVGRAGRHGVGGLAVSRARADRENGDPGRRPEATQEIG